MKHVNKEKRCFFKTNQIIHIDYKNYTLLLKFVDYFGRIKSSYYTGTSRKMQNKLSNAIKKARHMGLIAFTR